jgi:hypothetical protein
MKDKHMKKVMTAAFALSALSLHQEGSTRR